MLSLVPRLFTKRTARSCKWKALIKWIFDLRWRHRGLIQCIYTTVKLLTGTDKTHENAILIQVLSLKSIFLRNFSMSAYQSVYNSIKVLNKLYHIYFFRHPSPFIRMWAPQGQKEQFLNSFSYSQWLACCSALGIWIGHLMFDWLTGWQNKRMKENEIPNQRPLYSYRCPIQPVPPLLRCILRLLREAPTWNLLGLKFHLHLTFIPTFSKWWHWGPLNGQIDFAIESLTPSLSGSLSLPDTAHSQNSTLVPHGHWGCLVGHCILSAYHLIVTTKTPVKWENEWMISQSTAIPVSLLYCWEDK